MKGAHSKMQEATFDRFDTTPTNSWSTLSQKHVLPIIQMRRGYDRWVKTFPESHPVWANDIHIPYTSPVRPCQMAKDEEDLLADAIRLYAEQNLTLKPTSVRDLVQEYVSLLPEKRKS